MNRRSFLKTTIAAAAASLVPSWLMPKAPINLAAFCWGERYEHRRFPAIVKPFIQWGAVDDKIGRKPWQQKFGLPGTHAELFRYATNSSICIRVPGSEQDTHTEDKADLPPAMGLPWTHDWPYQGKWLKWPAERYLLADDTPCPTCDGYGCMDGIIKECERCDGLGQVWYAEDSHFPSAAYPKQCPVCKGQGHIKKDICKSCGGNAYGVHPGIQQLGNIYIDSKYDSKIRTHLQDVEWFMPKDGLKSETPIKFRFDGGVGLLMSLKTEIAKERLVAK